MLHSRYRMDWTRATVMGRTGQEADQGLKAREGRRSPSAGPEGLVDGPWEHTHSPPRWIPP